MRIVRTLGFCIGVSGIVGCAHNVGQPPGPLFVPDGAVRSTDVVVSLSTTFYKSVKIEPVLPLIVGRPSSQKLTFYIYNSVGKRITGPLPEPITLSDADPNSQTSLSSTTLTEGLQTVTLSFKGRGTTAILTASAENTLLGSYSDVTYLPQTATFEPSQPNENYPTAMTLGKNGYVWARLSGGYGTGAGFAQIAQSGTYTIYFDNAVTWGQSSPAGIAADTNGNIWSYEDTGAGGFIVRISPTGAFAHFSLPFQDYNFPVGSMTLGPDKAIWFTIQSDIYAPNASSVGRIAQNGTIVLYPLPDPNQPTTIVSGRDGNLWVADGYSIAKVTPAGVVTGYRIRQLPQGAGDFCAGSDGNFWSILPPGVSSSIVKFDVNGKFVSSTSVHLSSSSGMAGGCATDASGNIYYGDRATQSVGRVTPKSTVVEWPIVLNGSPYRDPQATAVTPSGTLFYGDWATQSIGGFGKVNPSDW